MTSLDGVNEGEAEVEATKVFGVNCKFDGKYHIVDTYIPFVERSYENCKWYYIVCKPFTKAYSIDPDWYQSKGIDEYRKYFTKMAKFMILTREILKCAKTHHNILLVSDEPMDELDDKNIKNKCKLKVKQCNGYLDRKKVLEYMFKENIGRPFLRYVDYMSFEKKNIIYKTFPKRLV